MDTLRRPYQGVWNIIRFNWHFYAISLSLVLALLLLNRFQTIILTNIPNYIAGIILLVTSISLIISFYIYDLSDLYKLNWINPLIVNDNKLMVNINAGFDETSSLIQKKFPQTKLTVLDFYDPDKHTEISIKRARKSNCPYKNTLSITTAKIPLPDQSAGSVFLILSAHEIRADNERILFFKELKRILKPEGKILVTEHLRDIPNFLAYTFGFFHFHSRKTWLGTFQDSELKICQEIKITPFLTTFVLQNA